MVSDVAEEAGVKGSAEFDSNLGSVTLTLCHSAPVFPLSFPPVYLLEYFGLYEI